MGVSGLHFSQRPFLLFRCQSELRRIILKCRPHGLHPGFPILSCPDPSFPPTTRPQGQLWSRKRRLGLAGDGLPSSPCRGSLLLGDHFSTASILPNPPDSLKSRGTSGALPKAS